MTRNGGATGGGRGGGRETTGGEADGPVGPVGFVEPAHAPIHTQAIMSRRIFVIRID